VVLLIGGLRIMEGQFTVGELVAFQVLFGSFLAPVEQLVGMASVIQTARADVERLDDVLRHSPDPSIPEELPAVAGTSPFPSALPGGGMESSTKIVGR
jgi:ABC-type bacteriocin/lantibiotic exporter with double-glycine peptidase domain